MTDQKGKSAMSRNLMDIYNDIFSVPEGKKRSNFTKFFPYQKEKDFRTKIDMLYAKYYETEGSYEYDADSYACAMKEAVSGISSKKDAMIAVYKEFSKLLENKYGLEIHVDYPPIPVSNTMERLMFIAKFMQDEKKTVSDISDILWTGSRTIEKDLAVLRGETDDPLQVCGQKFVISDITRSRGHLFFESTAHPFFLACNLTQVIAELEGLKIMSERPEFAEYAMPLARNIWNQLSQYGRDRIIEVMENLLGKDTSWYKALEQEEGHAYRTERECCQDGAEVLMYCLKETRDARLCHVEYAEGEKSVFLTDVKVLGYGQGGWKVSVGGKERILDQNKIIRSSFHKENMF